MLILIAFVAKQSVDRQIVAAENKRGLSQETKPGKGIRIISYDKYIQSTMKMLCIYMSHY